MHGIVNEDQFLVSHFLFKYLPHNIETVSNYNNLVFDLLFHIGIKPLECKQYNCKEVAPMSVNVENARGYHLPNAIGYKWMEF